MLPGGLDKIIRKNDQAAEGDRVTGALLGARDGSP